MSNSPRFTVSIVGTFLLFGIPAALLVFLGSFLVPDWIPWKPEIRWSTAQYVGYSLALGAGVGGGAAAVLVLLRSILPQHLRSRIVWHLPHFSDRTTMKRQIVQLMAVAAMFFFIARFVGGRPLDETKLLGMTPAEVRAECGERDAIVDFRGGLPGDDVVNWRYRSGLFGESQVTFADGVVVSVSHRAGK